MQCLPHPVQPIDHGVVQVEGRVCDTGVQVRVGARKCLVTTAVDAWKPRALCFDLSLECRDVPGCLANGRIQEGVFGVDARGQPAAQIASHAVWVVDQFVGYTDPDESVLLRLDGPEIGRLAKQIMLAQGWLFHSAGERCRHLITYFANGPLAMQPPPSPDGMCNPPEPVDPLWWTNSPSDPMLDAEPSKTGDSRRLSWCENQFQYCGGNQPKGCIA